jgi:putative peptidoglycan lipid II flippase
MTTDAIVSTATRGAGGVNKGSRSAAVVRDSLTGAIWTGVSRGTGLAQSIAVASILGATYLGNTYQAINSLPNIIYYQLLAGSLFASILVPPLVSRRDAGDRAGTEALARGFFGTLLVAGGILSVILLLTGPAILHVLTLGVADRATAELQRSVGMVFFVIFVPQIVFYITAGTGAAVMNAHGRFALGAGAPAIENLGMITTIIIAGVVFGVGRELADVKMPEILLLGLGTTASVAAHATAQWLGARSCGVRLWPRVGWRDPEVRRVLRRVMPTLGYTGLAALQTVAVLVIANRLAGGLVAFQLALNFFFLPTAIITWPIARSMLPHLSRLTSDHDQDAFWQELCGAVRLAMFVTAPMAVGYSVLATPIARAIALGQMESGGGVRLVALSLAALSFGVIGETWFILGTYAFYAREDARSPLRSMFVRTGIAVAAMSLALSTTKPIVLLVLGFSISAGSLAGSIHLWAKLEKASGGHVPSRPFVRTMAAAFIMAVPATIVAWLLSRLIGGSELAEITVVLAAAAVGGLTYVLLQSLFGAPEIVMLRRGAASLFRRGSP